MQRTLHIVVSTKACGTQKSGWECLTCDTLAVVLLLVSVHPNFVAANDGVEAVLVAESLGYIRSELHANATFARATARRGLRICPQHLHHQARLAGLSLGVSVELANIVKRDLVVGEQTSVENKILGADQGGERKSRKALREQFEDTIGGGNVSLGAYSFLISDERTDRCIWPCTRPRSRRLYSCHPSHGCLC